MEKSESKKVGKPLRCSEEAVISRSMSTGLRAKCSDKVAGSLSPRCGNPGQGKGEKSRDNIGSKKLCLGLKHLVKKLAYCVSIGFAPWYFFIAISLIANR